MELDCLIPDPHLDLTAKQTLCRLKCNRQRPCQNCETRGDISDCVYAVRGDSRISKPSTALPRQDVQQRVDRLENLLLAALGGGNALPRHGLPLQTEVQQANVVSSPPAQRNVGILETDSAERQLYSGDTAWNSVLHEVSDHFLDDTSVLLGHLPLQN